MFCDERIWNVCLSVYVCVCMSMCVGIDQLFCECACARGLVAETVYKWRSENLRVLMHCVTYYCHQRCNADRQRDREGPRRRCRSC